MRELHLFTMKEYITRFHLACKEVEATVDEWIAENNVQEIVKTEYIEHAANGFGVGTFSDFLRYIGFEAATYGFFNELEAMQFKLTFGEDFDYTVIDQD
jgi:hypothetical protein